MNQTKKKHNVSQNGVRQCSRVIGVKPIGKKKVVDLTVNKNHTFISTNGVVVHNCNSTQPALRGAMEEFSKNCRFILTANYSNKIIDPLKSRCSNIEFKFSRADTQKMAMDFDKRTREILQMEGVEYEKKVLAQLIVKYIPDFRKILNELQHHTTGGVLNKEILTNLNSSEITKLFGMLKDPSKWNDMRKWVVDNADNDFSLIIRSLYESADQFIKAGDIPSLVMILAEADYKASFVADKEIHTVAMLTDIMSQVEFK